MSMRDAIFKGVRRRTEEFNKTTFPLPNEGWTDEQMFIYQFLNGESGGFSGLHESDKPEIAKALSRIAGIDVPSRFNLQATPAVPAFTTVVLRGDGHNGYPGSVPLIRSRITGFYLENGSGGSSNINAPASRFRPATEDDVRMLEKNFPDAKLRKLSGAIEFPNEEKLRASLVRAIIRQTKEFSDYFEPHYPDGITESGKVVIQLKDNGEITDKAKETLSKLLNDPAILLPHERVTNEVTFLPFCAVVHNGSENSQSYRHNEVHVQAGTAANAAFFSHPDESSAVGGVLGNNADTHRKYIRSATEEEIKEYVQNISPENLYLYTEALTTDQINTLLGN